MIRRTIATTLTALAAGTAALAASPPAAAQVTPVAAPGMPIFQHVAGRTARCTLGYAASNAAHAPLAVTAGHCGSVGTTVRDQHGYVIGTYAAVQPDNIPERKYGYSIIKLRNTVATSAAITATMQLRQQRQAGVGDHVCLFGTTSGVKCGTVSTITTQVGSIDKLLSDHGDSGGPIVRIRDNALVGILIAHNDAEDKTYFEPITNIHRLTSAAGAGGVAFDPVLGD